MKWTLVFVALFFHCVPVIFTEDASNKNGEQIEEKPAKLNIEDFARPVGRKAQEVKKQSKDQYRGLCASCLAKDSEKESVREKDRPEMWKIILLIYFLILVSCQDHPNNNGNGKEKEKSVKPPEKKNHEGGWLHEIRDSLPGNGKGRRTDARDVDYTSTDKIALHTILGIPTGNQRKGGHGRHNGGNKGKGRGRGRGRGWQ
uniref:Uncharacterized protein n=1 Tax=Magallana gigas TaxID=29159 RepID=A0A8W8HYM6_MAGGI